MTTAAIAISCASIVINGASVWLVHLNRRYPVRPKLWRRP